MKKILLTILSVISLSANAQFWNEKATGFTTPARGLYSISIVDANVVWALGSDSTTDPVDTSIKEFTKSSDGGITWIPGTIDLGPDSTDMGPSSITAVSSTTAWISVYPGATNTGGVWKTTDGGTIWEKQPTAPFSNPIDSYANFVHFWDANNGVAAGDPENGEFEIYTTADGGTTWTRVLAENIPDPIIIDVNPDPLVTTLESEYGWENLYEVSGNNIWFGTDRGRIFKSNDKGLTWTAHQSPSVDFGLDKFTFSDSDKGLLLIYDNTSPTLYSTTDGGASWNSVATTMPPSTDIAYIPGTSTVVCGNSAGTELLGSNYSLDNGLTWINIDAVPHGILAFLNSSFGFSGGINTDSTTGGIFKFSGIPLKAAEFDVKNQISAYPNPTKGILKLDAGTSLIKEASVFDLLGRQVHSSKFSGLNNVTLDIHSLQTGTYILKVTSDSGKTETAKIIKD